MDESVVVDSIEKFRKIYIHYKLFSRVSYSFSLLDSLLLVLSWAETEAFVGKGGF